MNANVPENAALLDALGSFHLDETSGVPLWIQIRKRLMLLITSGKYEAGSKLPSVREMSVRVGVNYNTINKVYQGLEQDGYVHTKRGLGTYVSDLRGADLSRQTAELETLAADLVERALALGLTPTAIRALIDTQLKEFLSS